MKAEHYLMGWVRRAVFKSSTILFFISVSSSSKAYRVCICSEKKMTIRKDWAALKLRDRLRIMKNNYPIKPCRAACQISPGKQCLRYKTESRWGCSCGLAAAYHFATLAETEFSDYSQKSYLPLCPQKTEANLEQWSAVIYGYVKQSL